MVSPGGSRQCPRCGASNELREDFCGDYGAALAANAGPAATTSASIRFLVSRCPTSLEPLVAGHINMQVIRAHWQDILRVATSIMTGTVTASVMLRKLAAYQRQNGLAHALRELGKVERTLFTLDWMQDPELRRRSHVGLNKGEQQNALRRAVFFNRLGEIRDRSYENQRYRASGLNLVVAAIVLWNTVYLQRAIDYLRSQGVTPKPHDLVHLSPLGWEHINLTGDYHWTDDTLGTDQFRPLRTRSSEFAVAAQRAQVSVWCLLLFKKPVTLRLVCMARNDLLYQPRTRGSRMDRSANLYHGRPRTGRSLCRSPEGVWRRRTGQPLIGDHHDQRLESTCHRFPQDPGQYQPHKIA